MTGFVQEADIEGKLPIDVIGLLVGRALGCCALVYVLSLTTRRSILLIRSERNASAALIAVIVCRKVLTRRYKRAHQQLW